MLCWTTITSVFSRLMAVTPGLAEESRRAFLFHLLVPPRADWVKQWHLFVCLCFLQLCSAAQHHSQRTAAFQLQQQQQLQPPPKRRVQNSRGHIVFCSHANVREGWRYLHHKEKSPMGRWDGRETNKSKVTLEKQMQAKSAGVRRQWCGGTTNGHLPSEKPKHKLHYLVLVSLQRRYHFGYIPHYSTFKIMPHK